MVICLALVGLFSAGTPKGVEPQSRRMQSALHEERSTIWIVPGGDIDVTVAGKLTPAQLELYTRCPPRMKRNCARDPTVPVIIDGVKYKPEDISLFNGKRLRFIAGKDGTLYAFYNAGRFGAISNRKQINVVHSERSLLFLSGYVVFGESFGIAPGNGYPYLSQMGMDKAISSTEATTARRLELSVRINTFQVTVRDAGRINYSMLIVQGWNDRAIILYVSPY